jgi:hypothetical protein
MTFEESGLPDDKGGLLRRVYRDLEAFSMLDGKQVEEMNAFRSAEILIHEVPNVAPDAVAGHILSKSLAVHADTHRLQERYSADVAEIVVFSCLADHYGKKEGLPFQATFILEVGDKRVMQSYLASGVYALEKGSVAYLTLPLETPVQCILRSQSGAKAKLPDTSVAQVLRALLDFNTALLNPLLGHTGAEMLELRFTRAVSVLQQKLEPPMIGIPFRLGARKGPGLTG